MRWFNMPYLRNTLKQGERWIFTGTPIYKDGRLMLEQPEYCKREKYLQLMETFQPIYPLTTGLSNKTVQKAQAAAFEMYREEEYLPETVRNYYDLEPVNTALREVHFPTGTEHLMEAKKRIIFDEFFRFFSALELVKDRGGTSTQSLYYSNGRTRKEVCRKFTVSSYRGTKKGVK